MKRYQAFEPEEGYWLAFSGGKDSCVIKRLAEMAGVKHEVHYNVTSVDPPELVRFIKAMPEVALDIPHYKDGSGFITMWNLIPRKMMPPTRLVRYCCEKLKESGGKGRLTVTGVRWDESLNRKKGHGVITEMTGSKKKRGLVLNDDNDEARRMVEMCYRTSKTILNPIVDWTDADVWEFIKTENIPYCGLYDEGYKRLGCIGCPMSNRQEQELEQYPKYKALYLKTFERMLEVRKQSGRDDLIRGNWISPEQVYLWWLGKLPKTNPDQISFEL
nr:phosphoadenosine phosphosulfate reductase family protein [Christensenella hongkongensis]